MNFKSFLDSSSPHVLSVLRIVTALLFMAHGTAKLLHYPVSMGNVELFSLEGLAGTLEVFGGGPVLLGLFTRPTVFILSGEMAFAYFMAHAPGGFFPIMNHGESAVLLLCVPVLCSGRERSMEPGRIAMAQAGKAFH